MIKSITVHAPNTSYKEPVCITELNRVNLFYGINGTGKTILSNYLGAADLERRYFFSLTSKTSGFLYLDA